MSDRGNQRDYESLLNSVDGMIYEAEFETFRLTFMSNRVERILGYTSQQCIQNPRFFEETIHPDDRQRVLNFCAAEAAAGRDHRIHYRMVAADGRIVWVLNVATVILENNRPARIRGILLEVSQLKGAEEAAGLQAREMEALVAMASILADPGDFHQRATRLLETLLQVCEVDRVSLRVPDTYGDGLRLVATAGTGAVTTPPQALVPYSLGLAGAAFTRGAIVAVDDYLTSPITTPQGVALGMRSGAGLPIKADGKTIAVIALLSLRPSHFTPPRLRFLAAMADGMGALLRNSRLQEQVRAELEDSSRRLGAFEEAATGLSLQVEPQEALKHMVETARKALTARWAGLVTWRPDLGSPEHVASGFGPGEQEQVLAALRARGVLESIRDQRQGRAFTLQAEPGVTAPGDWQSKTAFLGVPVLSKGECIGVLYVAREEERSFCEKDQQHLNAFASLLGALVDNMRLYGQVVNEQVTLAAVQSSIVEGLVVVDDQGRLTFFNSGAERFSGLKAEEVIGRPWQEVAALVAPMIEPPHALQALVQETTGPSFERPFTVELAMRRGDRRQDVAVTAFPIFSAPRGRMAGFLIRDVTPERELERQRDAFLSIASHELRTPLGIIANFAELLSRRDPDEATRQDWLTRIRRNADRLLALVDDLLSVSRIRSGALQVEREELALGEVVEETIALVRPMTDKHRFVTPRGGEGPRVIADRDKLSQVLANLLDNAVKYSPRGGDITVFARHEPGQGRVVIAVADQGIGIAQEDITKLFTTFQRIQRKETEHVRGTGLGLYIVKSLVELMQGSVWVESQLGVGSTFYIALPAAAS